jgi:hypothetical protein
VARSADREDQHGAEWWPTLSFVTAAPPYLHTPSTNPYLQGAVPPDRPSSAKAGIALGCVITFTVLTPLGLVFSFIMFMGGVMSTAGGDDSGFHQALIMIGVVAVGLAALAITGFVLGILGLKTKQRGIAIAALATLGAVMLMGAAHGLWFAINRFASGV